MQPYNLHWTLQRNNSRRRTVTNQNIRLDTKQRVRRAP